MLEYLEKIVDWSVASIPRTKPSKKQAQNAYLIAHRGAHEQNLAILENTDAAFARAVELKCDGIEFDIHACADDHLIVNHDPTLERIWNLPLSIAKTSFETIRTSTPLIPSLEEMVYRYGKRIHLYIELKSQSIKESVLAEVLSPLTPGTDYHLLSLDEQIFDVLKGFPRSCMLLVPLHHNVKRFCELSIERQYGGVLGHYLLMRNNLVASLRKARQIAGVGFIDSKYSLYRELNRNIRYLFTNNAANISPILQALRQDD